MLSHKFLNIVWTTWLGSASPSIPLMERWLCQLEGEATLSRMPWTMYANFWVTTLALYGYLVALTAPTLSAPLKNAPLSELLLVNVISKRRSAPPKRVAVAGAVSPDAVPVRNEILRLAVERVYRRAAGNAGSTPTLSGNILWPGFRQPCREYQAR